MIRGFAGSEPPAGGFPRPRSAPSPAHLREPATARKPLATALRALRPRPVVTVDDLLEHTPFRHEDYRSARTLAEMAPGEEATVICTVERVRVRPTRRRNLVIVEAAVRDDSGPGVVIWFNQRYLAKQLRPGMRLSIRGERRPTIAAEIVAKSYERADDDSGGLHTAGLVPVYPASEGVSSRQLRALADEALAHAGDQVDPLPDRTKVRRALPLRRDALTAAHRPETQEQAWAGKGAARLRRALPAPARHARARAPSSTRSRVRCRCRRRASSAPATCEALPFELTGAQDRAITAIDADVGRDRPMRRLLQGDVGSGKTAVAAHALVRAVESGGQGALMAPTETLATQHLIGLSELLVPLGVRVIALMQGDARGRAPGGDRRGRGRRPARRRRHPRPDPGPGRVRDAAGGGRRRAAPLRRRAARARSRTGRSETSPHVLHDDGDADPAHARAHASTAISTSPCSTRCRRGARRS